MAVFILVYFYQVLKGRSTPNPTTWVISFIIMGVNALTYYFTSMEDRWSLITPVVILIGIFMIITYSFLKGKFCSIGEADILTIILVVLIIIVCLFWSVTKNSIASNLMVQVILVIGNVPTIAGLLENRSTEGHIAWTIPVVSYSFMIISILTRVEWRWFQLGYPIINGLIGNGSIAITAYLKRKKTVPLIL